MGVAFPKPPLFLEKKSFLLFCMVIMLLLTVRVAFFYKAYEAFVVKPFYYTYATVLQAYPKTKNKKTYWVLKLKSDYGFTFYTTSYQKKDFLNKRLRLQIFPTDAISFREYLGSFYVKSRIKKEENLSVGLKENLLEKVALAHTSPLLKAFFNAIFFATPISKTLREKISILGVSHLVALSGFHLGILWGIVYGVIFFFYGFFQQRFFPYRYAYFDIGLVALLLLGGYVWFVGSPDSLVRSYAMLFMGWGLVILGVEFVSFKFLTAVVLLLCLLFPSLLVSWSFYFSVAGVFYIFLLLYYIDDVPVWVISFVVIPFGVFVLMLPLVHGVFPIVSALQLLSPFLSLGFMVFYPLVIVLHFVGLGDMFDEGLLALFHLSTLYSEEILSFWWVLGYVLLSVTAIWHKSVFYLLCFGALGYMVYLFIFVEQVAKL